MLEGRAKLEMLDDTTNLRVLDNLRLKIFSTVFSATLIIGLGAALLLPKIYENNASVLMSAPATLDAEIEVTDLQLVAIQRNILLSDALLQKIYEQARDLSSIRSVSDLRSMLAVEQEPGTNLLNLVARGETPSDLPLLLNTWINIYAGERSHEVTRSKERTTDLVEDELAALDRKLIAARAALSEFRRSHDIISAERQENEILARLRGITDSANKATEEEIKAKAELDSLRAAIAGGEKIVARENSRSIAIMEADLIKGQNKLAGLRERFTEEYISRQPELRELVEEVADLEEDYRVALRRSQRLSIDRAEQAYASAKQATAEINARLQIYRKDAAQFSDIYATHQALVSDLERLEELNRETQARLVQVQITEVEKYPQVTVVSDPQVDELRIGPNYLYLAGGTLGLAMLLGIFAVWLYGFLNPAKMMRPTLLAVAGVGAADIDVRALESVRANAADQRLPQGNRRYISPSKSSDSVETDS